MEEDLVNAEDAGFTGGTTKDARFGFLVQEAVDICIHVPTILARLLSPCSQAAVGMKAAKRPPKVTKYTTI